MRHFTSQPLETQTIRLERDGQACSVLQPTATKDNPQVAHLKRLLKRQDKLLEDYERIMPHQYKTHPGPGDPVGAEWYRTFEMLKETSENLFDAVLIIEG